jgi:hypothetical protein
MIRRLILSASALAAGLVLAPAAADAHPIAPVAVYRPDCDPPRPHHRHHHAIFGVRVFVPAPPVVVARPVVVAPAPVVVTPPCPPAPVVYPTPYRR